MPKYVLQVAYNGSHFFGFQRQPNAKTVQGELEKAFSSLFGDTIELVAAGRTDTGVHAAGQVVAFEADRSLPLEAVVDGANGKLGDYISIVRGAELVADSDFHPRFSARSRTYRYHLLTNCKRDSQTLWGANFWCVGGELNLERVNEACQIFVGKHDFTTFSSRCDMPSMIREVNSFSVEQVPWLGSEKAYILKVNANAFLRKMVRLLVAAVVEVGLGLRECSSIGSKLSSQDTNLAPHPAPSSGLCFHEVSYKPDPFEIAARTYCGREFRGLLLKK